MLGQVLDGLLTPLRVRKDDIRSLADRCERVLRLSLIKQGSAEIAVGFGELFCGWRKHLGANGDRLAQHLLGFLRLSLFDLIERKTDKCRGNIRMVRRLRNPPQGQCLAKSLFSLPIFALIEQVGRELAQRPCDLGMIGPLGRSANLKRFFEKFLRFLERPAARIRFNGAGEVLQRGRYDRMIWWEAARSYLESAIKKRHDLVPLLFRFEELGEVVE